MEDYVGELFDKIKGKKAGKKDGQQESELESRKPLEQAVMEKRKLAQLGEAGYARQDVVRRPAEARIQQPAAEASEEEIGTQAEEKLAKTEKVEIDSYGNAKIYKVPGEELLYYWSPVIRLGGTEKSVINTLKEAATRIISISSTKIRDKEQRKHAYSEKVLEIIKSSPELNVPKSKYDFYADAVVREMVGYGQIDFLVNDDNLEEIMIIGPNLPVYVFHRKYEMMFTNIEFNSDSDIQDLINRIAREVGRRVDMSSPLLDARLPNGSRVNATLSPTTVEGSTLTIRKFREDPYTILDLINNKTLNVEAAAFLWVCMEGLNARPANMLVAGGTGSGKTTTLNVLASFIPHTERIITIEDTAELSLPLTHWIRMESRPPSAEGTNELTMDILTKNSLRMRPDRIIVGEIRHDEAFTLFTAFNTGHDGSIGTVHANSPQETIIRVTSPPMNVPEVMLSGLNFIIVQHRLHDKKIGTIRRVTEIAEVTGALKGKAKTNTVYRWDAARDTLKRTDEAMEYMALLQDMTGLDKKSIEEEIASRAEFFRTLIKEGVKGMKPVSDSMRKYLLEKG